jgi:hypothetical protein
MVSKAGGGINSNKKVEVGVKTGSARSGVNPGFAGQIGPALGTHIMDGKEVRGAPVPMKTAAQPYPSKLGNEVALNSGQRPGQGRTVHGRGSQGQHGGVAQGEGVAKGRDILSGYGPESKGAKR